MIRGADATLRPRSLYSLEKCCLMIQGAVLVLLFLFSQTAFEDC